METHISFLFHHQTFSNDLDCGTIGDIKITNIIVSGEDEEYEGMGNIF